MSANVELSNEGTGIIKLDSIAQNTTVFVQEPSSKTEESPTNSLLERNIKSMSLWPRWKKSVCVQIMIYVQEL